MADTEKELWKAIVDWFEIVKQTNERLVKVRQELDEIKLNQR